MWLDESHLCRLRDGFERMLTYRRHLPWQLLYQAQSTSKKLVV